MRPAHPGPTGWALAAALVLAFAAAAAARAPAAAAITCPPPPTTVAALLQMERHSNGDLNTFRPVACYGDRTLSLHGYVVATTGLGGTSAWVVAPAWLGDWWKFVDFALQPTSAHDPANASYGVGPYFFVRSRAGWNPHPLAPYVDRWVIVQGHFDDPAARTCHVARAYTSSLPTRAQVVRECREVFVISAVLPAGATPPATDTAGGAVPSSHGDAWSPVLVPIGGFAAALGLLVLRQRGARSRS